MRDIISRIMMESINKMPNEIGELIRKHIYNGRSVPNKLPSKWSNSEKEFFKSIVKVSDRDKLFLFSSGLKELKADPKTNDALMKELAIISKIFNSVI